MIAIDQLAKGGISPATEDDFLDYALAHGFGDLHFKVDKVTGMKAIIVIHSTKRGPSLGGCRFMEYPTTTSAIYDALRLAQGMSYKAASVNLPLGGGKSVIIKPQGHFDRQAYFHAFGQFIEELNGRYITALDSGTLLSDMDIIGQHTRHVASLSHYNGDPSPSTAQGVFQGIEAAVAFKLKKDSLQGLHVAIQGLGHVGYALAAHLHKAGAKLTVADVNAENVIRAQLEFGASVVPPEMIHCVPCDVFSPCALGAGINDSTISQLQTSIVAGAANNQLAYHYHGQLLHQKGILYAPDYVINAGGLILAASKYFQTETHEVTRQIEHIALSLQDIFKRAEHENRPTSEIADIFAQEKLA